MITIVPSAASVSEQQQWCRAALDAHDACIKPIRAGDPRHGELMANEDFRLQNHPDSDPELLGRLYWSHIVAPGLPFPPIDEPAWATARRIEADTWDEGRITVSFSGSREDAEVDYLFTQTWEIDPLTEEFTEQPAYVRIGIGDDSIWTPAANLTLLQTAATAAVSILNGRLR